MDKKDEWVTGWLSEGLLLIGAIPLFVVGLFDLSFICVVGSIIIGVMRMIERDRRKNG